MALWLSALLLKAAPGDVDAAFAPNLNALVCGMAVQPDGKIVVGGAFTNVGGITRNGIVRLNAEGTLDIGFNPSASGSFYDPNATAAIYSTVVQADGKIVIGGDFSAVDGATRRGIARLNADGTLDTGFNPNANDSVRGLAVQADGKILIAGWFTMLGETTRNHIARLNPDGTVDTGFNPNANSGIYTTAVQADRKIIIGGYFTLVGGVTRNHVARLNPDGTLDTGFNPDASAVIDTTTVQADGKIVVGGLFTTVSGVTRNHIARFHADGTLDLGFNPNAGGTVYSLAVQTDGKILLGHYSTSIGGVARNYVARLNPDGTLDTDFTPDVNSYAYSVAVQADGKILLGGIFTTVDEVTRNRIARLENGVVSASLTVPSAGQIRWLRGGTSPEAQFVSFDLSTDGGTNWTALGTGTRIPGGWELTGLNLPASGHIRARARTVGGLNNASSGLVEMVAPLPAPEIAVEQPVGAPIADGGVRNCGTVLVGGTSNLTFTIGNVGSLDLTGLGIVIDGPDAGQFSVTTSPTAPVSGPTGTTTFTVRFAPTSIGPKTAVLHISNNDPDENPFDITLSGTGRIPAPGDVEPGFSPNPNGPVLCTAVQPDGKVVVGGWFTTVGGTARNYLARVHADGTTDIGFNPNVSSNIWSVAVQGDGKVLVGGGFTTIGGVARNHIARLNEDGTLDTSFNPNANYDVHSLAMQVDGKILLGGGFTNVGGVTRNQIAQLNADGTLDTGFNPNANNYVSSLAVQADGKILLGGGFTTVGGVTRNRIARLNADGTLDTGFNPSVSGGTYPAVYTVSLQADGRVLLGGGFTIVNGATRNRIARLNADGTLDTGFNPNVSGSTSSGVYTVNLQADGRILLGGDFTGVSGVTRNRIARLKADRTLDMGFNPDVGGDFPTVRSTAVHADGKILIGGQFTNLGGVARTNIALLENDAAWQSLTVPGNSRVQWLRDGASPEAQFVTFDLSTDGGANWTPIGAGTRITGGWEGTGLHLPASGLLRARARTTGGGNNGSSGLIEAVAVFNGLPVPEIVIEQPTGTSLTNGSTQNFGTNLAGINSSLTFTVKNTGSGDLVGLGISLEGLDANQFIVTSSPAVPVGGPNGSTSFSVQFAPTSAGLKSAVLRIASNDPDESPFDITLTGAGLAPEIAVEQPVGTGLADGGSKSFGAVLVGGTTSLTFTIKNTGNLDLTGLNITLDGPDAALFAVLASPTAPLSSPNGSSTFTVQFAPTSLGAKTAVLRIASNDPDEDPFDITLTGAGAVPEIAVEQPSGTDIADGGARDFGLVNVGGPTSLTFTIKNTGDLDLTGLGITIDGPDAALFTITANPTAPVIGPAGSTTFTVRFAPLSNGPKTAALHIASNDPDENPFDIDLTGTGWNPVSGDTDPDFNPSASDYVWALAVQADGKILVGGAFTTLGGQTRSRIARLNADGSLDTGFNPSANNYVYSLAVQTEGKILVGGAFTTLGGQSRNRIARLNADGSLDPGFNPSANDAVYSLAVQADGKILVAGGFTTLGGQIRYYIARLNADGSLDTGFNPSANNYVYSLAVQADGKILVAGYFTTVGGQTRNRIARLNADGSLDTGFNPSANDAVYSLAVQADGKILVAGGFTTLGGQIRYYIARLNADGSSDSGFNPHADWGVLSLAVQADRKILVGGWFTTLGGQVRNRIARLNVDGSLDPSFNPNANNGVYSLAVQTDGRILAGGYFSTLGGQTRNRIARLENGAAPTSLMIPNTGLVRWLRGGASPEAQSVGFDLSTDGGATWTPLGAGTRITGGWGLTGLDLPASGHIRARARTTSGAYNGSAGLVEMVAAFPAAEIAVEQPTGTPLTDWGDRNFGTNLVGSPSNLTFTIRNLGSLDLAGLDITLGGPDATQFSLTTTPIAPVIGPDGSTTFTVQFAPTSLGQKAAALHIASNDPDGSPFNIILTGAGGIPEIAVEQPTGTDIPDGGSRDFGVVVTGFSTNLTFTVKNTGNMDLNGLGITIDGPDASQFSVTTNPAVSVGFPNGSATFTVRFAPTSTGPKTATLHLASNDPDENPFDITLTGSEIPPAAEIAVEQPLSNDISDGGTTDFGLVNLNGPASLTFTIRNTGTADLTDLDIALDGPDANQFTITSSPGAPVSHPAGATAFTVRFAPTSIGPKTAALHIANNDPDENPFDVALTGNGRIPVAGDADTEFYPNVSGIVPYVFAAAMQPDGSILLGGAFTNVNGTPRNHIARLNQDGTLDSSFNPNAAYDVYGLATQPDGRIIIGGAFTTVGGVTRRSLARLNRDGTLDSSFNPNANGWVYGLAIQPDGKIIIGGDFTTVGGMTRNRVARLHTDGTLDAGFNPNASNAVYSIALQSDGEIVLGGNFTTVGGATHNRIARLNTDGTLDTDFNPSANSTVYCLALQADEKLVIGGTFSTVNGTTRGNCARLNADGSLDTGFNPGASSTVYSVAVQADGKIVLGGSFNTVGGVARKDIARLNPDGTLDANFNSNVQSGGVLSVFGLALQVDGQIVLGGDFFSIGGVQRSHLARLVNGTAATQSLAVTNANRVQWARGGAAPEAQAVSFELSTDGGNTWTALGAGTRINSGWELTNLSLPVRGQVRARARTTGGLYNGSSGLVESVTAFTFPPDIAVEQPAGTDIPAGGSRHFGTVSVGANTSLSFALRNIGGEDLTGLGITIGGPAADMFSVTANPSALVSGPDGSTAFTVRFAPTSSGIKIATLRIASNDPDESPFDITLAGSGTLVALPDINVTGNGVSITAGDSTPSASDHTDFGSALFGAGPVIHTFTIQNTGVGSLEVGAINISGLAAADFIVGGITLPVTVAANASQTFTVAFGPGTLGLRSATVTVLNDDLEEGSYEFAIRGKGVPPGSVDATFNPGSSGVVYTTAVQPDGKILIGGLVGAEVDGVVRRGIVRLHADGTLDEAFNLNLGSDYFPLIVSITVQPDEKIVIAGHFNAVNGASRTNLARLNPDGTLDMQFNPDFDFGSSGGIFCAAPQADGKLIIGGGFVIQGEAMRANIARLNEDGTLDSAFNPIPGDFVGSATVQADGRIVIGGAFRSVNGVGRNHTARLNPDGTLEESFDPNVNGDSYAVVAAVTPQADGRIIIAGDFNSVGGVTRNRIARLNADGTLDTDFNPDVSGDDYAALTTVTVQADGKIIMGGHFTAVGRVARNNVARVNADGTPDMVFDPNVVGGAYANGPIVYSVTAQADGKLIVGGIFDTVGGVAGSNLARLLNDGATQALSVPNTSRVEWLRGGASPEAQSVTFERSTDSGGSWVPLGWGTRVTGGWQLTGLSLPASGSVRARARVVGGYFNGSSGLIQAVAAYSGVPIVPVPDIEVEQPVGVSLANGMDGVSFGAMGLGFSSPAKTFTIRNTGTVNLTGIEVTADGNHSGDFSVDTTGLSTALSPGSSATFTVIFTPSASGSRTAAIHIASNDPNESPFDLTLRGSGRVPAPGDVDSRFNAESGGPVYSTAVQPDGKILIGGQFASVAGVPRTSIARLNVDGILDAAFNPSVNSDIGPAILGITLQTDGRIIVGGRFTAVGGAARTNLARLNADGTLDTGFSPNVNGDVNGMALQSDGKIIVVGWFTSVEGVTRNSAARLNVDGTVDPSFDPSFDGPVNSAVVQADGKIVIGGWFTAVNEVARTKVARLNANGTLDLGFNANPNDWVYCTALQADGKIVIGGQFTSVNELARANIARLNGDGTLDTGFNPSVGGGYFTSVIGITLQANGRIIIGGRFATVEGAARSCIARLNADGSLDAGFNPSIAGGAYPPSSMVCSVAAQADGKLVVGGIFDSVGGVARSNIARLVNEAATEEWAMSNASRVRWLRGGTAPEAQHVTFDVSIDGGGNWTPLGSGTRISGGWELDGLNLPSGGLVRGGARVVGGSYNGSSGVVEARAVIPAFPSLSSPFFAANQFRFLLPTLAGRIYQVEFTPSLSGSPSWETVRTVIGDGTAVEVLFNTSTPAGFYRVVLQP